MRNALSALYDAHGLKLRFLVVGVWNTVFGYGLFVVLLFALKPVLQPLATSDNAALGLLGHNWYLVVQWVSWVLSVPQSAVALKYFVFRSTGRTLPEIGRAYVVYLPMQGVSTVLL